MLMLVLQVLIENVRLVLNQVDKYRLLEYHIGLTVTNTSNTIPSWFSTKFDCNANFVGVVTATKFVGDGSH